MGLFGKKKEEIKNITRSQDGNKIVVTANNKTITLQKNPAPQNAEPKKEEDKPIVIDFGSF